MFKKFSAISKHFLKFFEIQMLLVFLKILSLSVVVLNNFSKIRLRIINIPFFVHRSEISIKFNTRFIHIDLHSALINMTNYSKRLETTTSSSSFILIFFLILPLII